MRQTSFPLLVGLMLFASGCSLFSAGLPCEKSGECPDGQVCAEGICAPKPATPVGPDAGVLADAAGPDGGGAADGGPLDAGELDASERDGAEPDGARTTRARSTPA